MEDLLLFFKGRQLIDCVGVSRHINPCGSFCVGRREIEETAEEMKERDRGERGK